MAFHGASTISQDAWNYYTGGPGGFIGATVDSTFIIDTAKDAMNGIYMNTGPVKDGNDCELYVGGGDYSSLYSPSADTAQIVISPGDDYVTYTLE